MYIPPSDERVGNLACVISDASLVPAMKSQLTWIIRGMYSNPPAHGARVVANVLANKQLFDEWYVSSRLDSFFNVSCSFVVVQQVSLR